MQVLSIVNKLLKSTLTGKIKNIQEKIKNSNISYWITYIKSKRQDISMIVLSYIGIIYFYYVPFSQETFKPYILLFFFLVTTFCAYRVFLKEAFFIQHFFNLEKYYYISKSDSLSESFEFQRSIDIFQSKLLSRVADDDDILFRKDIFNLRTYKVKKKIDIFFNYIIDVTFSLEFFNHFDKNIICHELSVEPTNDKVFQRFLIEFKDIFICHPKAFNLIALDNFFDFLINSINKNDGFYKNIEKEVNEYYTKKEYFIEKRAERRHEYIKSMIGTLFIFLLAFLGFIISPYLKSILM